MPGYREITVAGEGRPRRPGRAARGPAPLDWRAMLRGALARTLTLCRESPGTALGAVIAVAAAGLVCVNALGHQSGPHPAPILPKVAAKAAPPEPVKAAARPDPTPAPKQAARDAIGDLIRSDETTASVTPKPQPAKAQPVRDAAKPAAAHDKPAAAHDKSAAAPDKPAAKPDRAESSETPLMRAQRALAKLGYGIKPDGAMGPGTRAALEKFERDRKLPVTGEASGKTLRELMARAGQG